MQILHKCLKNHQKQGVRQLALELQKEVPILQNEKVPSFQDLLYNPAVPQRKNERIANTVVYHYLKNHENPGVRQLASKLQKEVPILLNEKSAIIPGPALQPCCSPKKEWKNCQYCCLSLRQKPREPRSTTIGI